MAMTFSSFGAFRNNNSKEGNKFNINNDLNKDENNFIQKIESASNFSREYSAKTKPADSLQQGRIKSLIFKTAENPNTAEVCYEYWELADGMPTYYTITVSSKDLQLESISTEYGYTVPTTAFRVNDRNEVELVYYGSCRR